MNAEIKVGPEKLGQAALHSRGLEDSRRLPRQGHNTHFKMKSCKALTRRGRAGRGGKKDAPAAVGRPQAWCPARRGDRFSSAVASTLAPSLGTRNSGSAAKPGSLGWLDAAERRKAFFKYPGVSSTVAFPHPAKWIAPPSPPQLFGCSGMFHCLPGPPAALQGTLAGLPGKAPDVTALPNPEQPSPIPSVTP